MKWNGQNYQQFWSTNYQGSFWVTNGINVPFTGSTIGMQFKVISTVTVLTATTATLAIASHGLSIGDFIFVNEVSTTTGINFQTGYVTAVPTAGTVTVTFPNANLATNGVNGIAQYLTNNSDDSKDCIRWYDGDPTSGNNGWVNFCPPLSQDNFSIADLPAAKYYLVGARMMVPFKDRLLFLGPVVQTSTGSPIYLKDTIVYSLNGTPYYTASFSGDVDESTTTFNPILVPANQSSFPPAFFSDSTGFGGFISAGVDSAITTCNNNEDVLIIGFTGNSNISQTRLIYTNNDLVPFNFYIIDSELPSDSTFSVVNLGTSVMTTGSRGFVVTDQTQAQRLDVIIPDEIFQFNLAKRIVTGKQ